MLDPAFYSGLWTLYDQTGIRPEWILPVLYAESGFRPELVNAAGYAGLNQMSRAHLIAKGIEPTDYVTWSASEQLNRTITPHFVALIKAFGSLESGTRVYQANFLPATLPIARKLSSVLVAQSSDPNHWYRDNADLDYHHTGAIRVSDLAHQIEIASMNATVQAAIANAYALHPFEQPTDPVLGHDFGAIMLGQAVSVLLAGGAVAAAVDSGALAALGRWWRSLWR